MSIYSWLTKPVLLRPLEPADYLPNRIGTASGVTVGLAVSIGGLFSPLLGWIADQTSLRMTLSVIVVLPALALLLSMRLHDQVGSSPSRREATSTTRTGDAT